MTDLSQIMDKAAKADSKALFAGLQAALLVVTDLYYGVERPHGPTLNYFLERVDEALERGKTYGT